MVGFCCAADALALAAESRPDAAERAAGKEGSDNRYSSVEHQVQFTRIDSIVLLQNYIERTQRCVTNVR